MPTPDGRLDWLDRWQEGYDRGHALSPQQLAPDAPAAWDELARRIERRRRLPSPPPPAAGCRAVRSVP